MPTLTAIRAALSTTITTAIPGLQGYPKVPESVIVPCFLVAPSGSDFTVAFGRGLDKQSLDVIVLAGSADDVLAQEKLDPYVNGFGSSSIREAVWNARTLGIGVEATVTGMSDYGASFTIGAIDYVGARLAVEVLTSGTA